MLYDKYLERLFINDLVVDLVRETIEQATSHA